MKQWISVDERLPDERVKVLAFIVNNFNIERGPGYQLAWREDDSAWATDDYYIDDYSIRVTHWMPLSEKPL